MYMYVYICICICICIYVHVSIYKYIYMVSIGSSYMVCINICGMVNDPMQEVFRIRYIRYNWYIIHIIPMNGLITIFDHHTFTTIYWPWRKTPMSVLGVA